MKASHSSKSEENYLQEAISQLPSYVPPDLLWNHIEKELQAVDSVAKVTRFHQYSFALISLVASICLLVGIMIGFYRGVHLRNNDGNVEEPQIYSATPSPYNELWEEEIEMMYQGSQRPDLETLAAELNSENLLQNQEVKEIKEEWDELAKMCRLLEDADMPIPDMFHEKRIEILQSYERWRWKDGQSSSVNH